MTFEILTTPAISPASLLFQQCLAEIVPDNKYMNMAKEEIIGYFLDKIEPTAVSEDLWMKVLNNSQIKKNSQLNIPADSFFNQLPKALQVHLADKKIKWKSFKDVKIATILPKDNNEKLRKPMNIFFIVMFILFPLYIGIC